MAHSAIRAGLVAAAMLVSSAVACGGVIVFGTDLEFSGGTPPEGTAPWLTATLDDGGTPGSVTLTLAATNLTDAEFVSQWYLNLDPALDPTALLFSAPTKTGTFDDPTISTGVNAFKADGDGKYDILFEFATTGKDGGSHRFRAGDEVEYTITGIGSLVAGSFDFLSAPDGDHGPFRMAAHVQGIGSSDEDSGWVTVPEPATLALLAAGFGFIAIRRRR